MHSKAIFFGIFSLLLALAQTSITKGGDPSLLGWWKLDDGEGTIAADSSGNNNHGTINNPDGGLGIGDSVWDIDPEFEIVLSLNGSDTDGAYVSVGNIPAMTLENGFTWAFWAKQDAAQGTNDDIIIGNRWNATAWIKFTPSLFEFGINSSVNSINYDNIPADTWVHHAVVKERTHYTYYRDGVISSENDIYNTSESLPLLLGGDTDGERWRGRLSNVRIYSRALSESEIRIVMRGKPGLSSEPNPPNEAEDISIDNTLLSWMPGRFAETHDVYLGTVFEQVQNAARDDPLGVLKIQDLDIETYKLDRLEFNRKYYWRVDEVNSPPDQAIYKGDIWSFTTEPLAYPMPGENIIATASGMTEGQGPENTINNFGLDINDLHSNSSSDMWLSNTGEPGSVWIQYEFDKAYKLREMQVWNYNGPLFLPGYGLKEATVEYSSNGIDWMQLGDIPEFTRATGKDGYAANTTIDLGDMIIKSVRITAQSNWGGGSYNKYGLSEVRFLYIPLTARKPIPDDGATDVAIDVILDWRAGREASEHNVYFSTDRQAVTDGNAPFIAVSQVGYDPMSLNLGQNYYWRIDEVNNTETPPVWQGKTWSFKTIDFLVVDNFESYNDIPEGKEGSNLVYNTWIDGYNNPSTNGATIGYTSGCSLETGITHGGSRRSVPVTYDNSVAGISKVTANPAELQVGKDFTKGSADTLEIWFYGDPNNAVTERMYAEINGSKVVYDGDADDIAASLWTLWDIELERFGVNLNNVTTFTIGFEKTAAIGGSGMIFVDEIHLYKSLN
ncbi:MAG: discoidin domain-containing protein [Sedimentisphaerales bacterium]|nr:discoidin domain-containing protein [Sedimentisphaerales bacterium]